MRTHHVEPLEFRRLLSVSLDDEILRITGTSGNDVLSLTRSGMDNVIVNDNGTTSDFDLDDIEEFIVLGEAGNDRVVVGNGFAPFDVALQVFGGIGDDSIVGGNNIEIFHGDAGNDTIRGNGAGDQLHGGGGNDSIDGGTGDDTLEGQAGNDSLQGGDGDDEAVGGAGNDTVIGGAGFDILDGSGGTDSVVGNAGDDSLFSGENPGGDDRTVFIDAAGIVRINGTPRADLVDVVQDGGLIAVGFGQATKWFLEDNVTGLHADLGAGDDFIQLRPDSPNLQFQPPATLLGGDGDDDLEGGGNADQISGGDGNDSLVGDQGDDHISGNAGHDTLDGGDGADTLLGGAGVNIHRNGEVNSGAALPGLSIEGETLRFHGTDAQDQVVVWRRTDGDLTVWIDGRQQNVSGDDVDEFEAFGNGGNDVLRLHFPIDLRGRLDGGSGNDKLIGGALGDVLLGGGDADTLFGNAGNDTLDGGLGPNQLFGADGRDTADYSARTENLFVNHFNVQGGFGRVSHGADQDILGLDIERVLGGSGNDRFVGDERNNTFIAGPGNDTLIGQNGNDALQGQAGDDSLIAGFGNDFLDAGDGNDTMYGQGGNDTLLGRSGNDALFAHDGARDTVDGGNDDDTANADGADLIDDVETVV